MPRHRFRRRHRCCCETAGGTLRSLSPGDSALIESFTCNGEHRRRLLSLGMIPGRHITCIRDTGNNGVCVRIGTSELFINEMMAQAVNIRRMA